MSKDKLLERVYYDTSHGFGSIRDTHQQAKKLDETITLDYVKEWMKKQPNKQIRPYNKFNSWVAPYPRFEYQIDLMVMNNVNASEFKYAIVVIDTFSKLAGARAMKDKETETVYKNLLEIFDKIGYPSSIYSDDDGSFKGRVAKFFKDENINHITTLTHAMVVERFIRTIKNMIYDRIRNTSNKWEEMLPLVINKYNNTIHSSHEMTPLEAHDDRNILNVSIKHHLKANYFRKYPNIKVGDEVKIYQKGKNNLSALKETRPKWSAEKYKVKEITHDITFNRSYKIEGFNKTFRRNELLLID